jgi:hypothetical protein
MAGPLVWQQLIAEMRRKGAACLAMVAEGDAVEFGVSSDRESFSWKKVLGGVLWIAFAEANG